MNSTLTKARNLLDAAVSVFGVRSVSEQPAYEVLEQLSPSIELRRYGPLTVVETPNEGEGKDDPFNRLFAYISGANRTSAAVAMTTPVEQSGRAIAMTTPVETAGGAGGRRMMRFFLPSKYRADTAPVPTDPRVTLATVPARDMAVIRFSGSGSDEDVAARAGELRDAISRRGLRPVSLPSTLFYDPPFAIPFLRRNEVAVKVERVNAAAVAGRA